jgi:hypothetical protein
MSGPGGVVFLLELAKIGGWLHRDPDRASEERV